MERQQDYVLRTVEERGVRLIRLWFTDVLGQLKSFAISPAELENAFEEGMQFDGSSIDGFSRVQESDVLARPDPNTFELLPWGNRRRAVGPHVLRHRSTYDGTPLRGRPPAGAEAQPRPGAREGLLVHGRPGDGVLLLRRRRPDASRRSRSTRRSYFDLTTADVASDSASETIHMLEAMGIPVEYSFHEDAPSQHEIDLRYTDALTMAENVMTFRLVVREVALEHGVHATFMPKPMERVQGSGMHTHFSLFEGDTNAFHDAGDPYGLSKVGRGVHRRPAAPRPRDHRGHQPVGELVQAARSSATRRPCTSRGRGTTARRWCTCPHTKKGKQAVDPRRVPGPGSGVQPVPRVLGHPRRRPRGHRGELRPAARDDGQRVPDDTEEERPAEGIEALPQSLSDALDVMEDSELVAEALGEHVFEWFLRNKRAEWMDYKAQSPSSSSTATYRHVMLEPDGAAAAVPGSAAARAGAGARPVGYPWKAVGDEVAAQRTEPDDGWAGAIVCADVDPEGAFAMCRALRKRDLPLEPLLLLLSGAQLDDLELRDDLFDDFCLAPFHPRELEARVKHLFWRSGRGTRPGADRVRRPDAEPRDLPGRDRRAGRSTSRTWSTSC